MAVTVSYRHFVPFLTASWLQGKGGIPPELETDLVLQLGQVGELFIIVSAVSAFRLTLQTFSRCSVDAGEL